jgi:lipooligosaccharide transport system permease protein
MTAPWMRATAYWTTTYKRTWRGSVFSSFLRPVLFLAAMGLGLGSLVDANGSLGDVLHGVSYVAYLAPGLLAMTALMVACQEAMWPVNGAVRWNRAYVAMTNAPLSPGDALAGHLAYMAYRVTTVAAAFVVVMLVFGAVESPWVVAAIPAAVLCGMSAAAPMAAYSVTLTSDSGFASINRFVITPMALFAGVFFPISQLPPVLRPVAWVTPMWHGVDLCRGLALGTIGPWRVAMHVAVLGAYLAVGVALSRRLYRRVLCG